MAQTLLLGLGGTGSRVVNNVVKELHKNGKSINNGEIYCAALDTNVNDNDLLEKTGTGVPIYATSKAQKIQDYFLDYKHAGIEDWCPQSPAFLQESMIDGASELRVKSRIAWMDCVESGLVRNLELMINEVLNNNANSKLRIMIVSSISGGTGAGMFIQVALWLRKFLSESQITIRGIFLLPDVFVETIKDIRDSKTTTVRHYCNAYAAIRELNTISRLMKDKSMNFEHHLKLDKVFDSDIDADFGKPVFDYAFFIDAKDEKGRRLESISEYEKMVAQLVYMQLYAPMKDSMYSEEDNAFLAFSENDNPLYGSCGTAKAVYPVDSVKTYCAIRAAQDSLTKGWKKIDGEIETLKIEREMAEKDGLFFDSEIDEQAEFVKIFEEKTSVKPEEAGRDRFFVQLARDIKNETKRKSKEDGKIAITYTDKVDDFLKELRSTKIDAEVLRNGGTQDLTMDVDTFVAADHTVEELKDIIRNDQSTMEDIVLDFDGKVEKLADAVVNSVFPLSMGDVNPKNRATLYGFLTKESKEYGQYHFVHPVAARYLLYKLSKRMEEELGKIVLADSRAVAIDPEDTRRESFDNKATREVEETPEAYLDSKKWHQAEGKFLDMFEKKYAEYINVKVGLIETYEKECLQVAVYRKLIERIKEYTRRMEQFFKKLGEVEEKFNQTLAGNIEETSRSVGKQIFVLGKQEEKEAMYKSLNFEMDTSEISKSVISSIYGCLCAEKRPNNEENKAYINLSVITSFIKETVMSFRRKIERDPENRDTIDLDIYRALCLESDMKHERAQKEHDERWGAEKTSDLSDLDLTTGQVKADTSAEQRHKAAFHDCYTAIHDMAAPFMIHTKETSEDDFGTKTARIKTFWGFAPTVASSCSDLATILGINADLQADDGYPKNELQCYRAVYGMEAKYIPKFNETTGGMYYKCYKHVIDEMVTAAAGNKGDRALVSTPHLDKSWHTMLPFVTEEMQEKTDLEFYHDFWLALAYGMVDSDKDKNLFIERTVESGYGSYTKKQVPIVMGRRHLTTTDAAKVIELLREDKVFASNELPAAKKLFAEEIEDLDNYVGTKVIKGLVKKSHDMNPVDFILRYAESVGNDERVTGRLIGALELIAREMVDAYGVNRSEESAEKAVFEICRKIYDSSSRTKGKEGVFKSWNDKFTELKIAGTAKKESAEK
ncbi:MAG: hypothetical protein IJC88_04800 [Oscillospiraceae bacterium]|nr:hypothetical protein [Oscillospiraceae bacterium]